MHSSCKEPIIKLISAIFSVLSLPTKPSIIITVSESWSGSSQDSNRKYVTYKIKFKHTLRYQSMSVHKEKAECEAL